MTAAHQSPAIVIAAGGDGRRMGGGKPLRQLAGQTLLDHAVAWAMRQSDACALAVRDAGQIPKDALPAPLPLLIDQHPGLGPVSALLNAMDFARQNARSTVMLIGCDQPFLPADLPTRLLAEIGPNAVAMPVSGAKDQPLASLWRINQAAVAAFIARGGRSLWRLADELGAQRVDWPLQRDGMDPFANINDPATLERFARSFPAAPQASGLQDTRIA
jgi:molybdopterin-guanine dinucleotide biosynthesis protein A